MPRLRPFRTLVRGLAVCALCLAAAPAALAQGSSYIYVSTGMTYADAEAYAISLGGTLPVITSAAENAAVLATIAVPEFHTWLALDDITTEGTFVWSDGTPFVYTNWGSRASDGYAQPDNFQNEDCVIMFGQAIEWGAAGTWGDVQCAAMLPFVVEFPADAQPPPPQTDLRLWLRADQGVNLDGSGNVSAWIDQTGSGLTATQATAAQQPSFVASGINGEPALNFDGTEDLLSFGDVLDDVFAGADKQFEMFVAFREDTPNGPSANGFLAKLSNGFGLGSDSHEIMMGTFNGRLDMITYHTLSFSAWVRATGTTVLSTTPHVGSYRYDGSLDTNTGRNRITFNLDGQAETATDVNGSAGDIQNGTSPLSVGAALDADGVRSDYHFDGLIAEILLYEGLLSSADRMAVETYLCGKYDACPATTSSLEITGTEGWRMVSASFPGTTYDDLLGPIWTQGFPGSDAPGATRPNVYTYDETATTDTNNDGEIDKVDGYVPISNQGATMPAGEGHFVYVYADDDFDGTPDAFPKTSPQSSVLLNPDPFPFPTTFTDSPADDVLADGWNLFGNPWATGMDWDAAGWTRTNVTDVLYVWDHNNAGGPQYVSWNGSAGGMGSGVIAPHQGFWAKASGTGPALQAPSAAKVLGGDTYNLTGPTPSASGPRPTTSASGPVLGLRVEGDLGGVHRANGAWATFRPEASVRVDDGDAFELEGWAPERVHLFWSAPDGTAFDVASLPLPRRTMKLPLAVEAFAGDQLAGGRFTLTWPQVEVPADWQVLLVDRETRERIRLDRDASYAFTLDGPVTNARASKTTSSAPSLSAPSVMRATGVAAKGQTSARGVGSSRFVLVIRTGRPSRLTDAEADALAAEALDGTPSANGLSAEPLTAAVPEVLALHAPSPNPTRGPVALRYDVPTDGPVRLAVYDALGREVVRLAEGPTAAGTHVAHLDTRDLSPGLYVARLTAGHTILTQRLTVVR
ncbi:MAG: lectin-like protein [Bacteroidota bacterium]